ncbi:UNVERIFIED_ORG: hypothetical protein J3D59_003458 [Pseudomonas fluorescens]
MEHRFVSRGRVVGVVVMRGLFRCAKGTLPPADFVRELGLAETSPPMPQWLSDWANSCDDMSVQLRAEEQV